MDLDEKTKACLDRLETREDPAPVVPPPEPPVKAEAQPHEAPDETICEVRVLVTRKGPELACTLFTADGKPMAREAAPMLFLQLAPFVAAQPDLHPDLKRCARRCMEVHRSLQVLAAASARPTVQ